MDVTKIKVFILDTQSVCREQMLKWLTEKDITSEVKVFDNYIHFIEKVSESSPQYCIIRLGENKIPGLKVAGMVQQLNPDTRIVFIAGERDYVLDAYEIGAHAFLLSPLNQKQFENIFS